VLDASAFTQAAEGAQIVVDWKNERPHSPSTFTSCSH
jgi:hypothetical protein